MQQGARPPPLRLRCGAALKSPSLCATRGGASGRPLRAPDVKIGLFDTNSDINNVMFSQYVPGHPFRFLSLYHGFDTSTLEE